MIFFLFLLLLSYMHEWLPIKVTTTTTTTTTTTIDSHFVDAVCHKWFDIFVCFVWCSLGETTITTTFSFTDHPTFYYLCQMHTGQ
jgi:hypothetical protein